MNAVPFLEVHRDNVNHELLAACSLVLGTYKVLGVGGPRDVAGASLSANRMAQVRAHIGAPTGELPHSITEILVGTQGLEIIRKHAAVTSLMSMKPPVTVALCTGCWQIRFSAARTESKCDITPGCSGSCVPAKPAEPRKASKPTPVS